MMATNNENKIISCYYQNISAALNSCFSKGHYRYLNLDGTFSVVEFPADQYKSAYVNMQNYIKQGEVFGIFNPLIAGEMFTTSQFTYEQVKNIVLSGMISKLSVNMETGEIMSPSDIGLSPIIAKALLRIDKNFFAVSDISALYECVKDIWKAEKIKTGFIFKKEVELLEDLQAIDTKCMNILKKYAFDYLLCRAEIEDIVTEIKGKKYIDYLKSVIDDPDCDAKITAKIASLVNDVVEDRKKFSFNSLYRQAKKSFGDKTIDDEESFSLKLFKRISAVFLVLLGYYSFFDSNYLESKLRPINEYAIKFMNAQVESYDRLHNYISVDTEGEFPAVSDVFARIKSAIMTAKVAYSSYGLVLDFGSSLFFQLLLPFVLVMCSVYLALGCKKMLAGKALGVSKIVFALAIMLRFFTPFNAYMTAKANEYIFNARYKENEKVIKFFTAKYDKSAADTKITKNDMVNLKTDIVRDSGETVSIILIQSLLIPIIALVLLKKILALL